jgi:hypothetical protein
MGRLTASICPRLLYGRIDGTLHQDSVVEDNIEQ